MAVTKSVGMTMQPWAECQDEACSWERGCGSFTRQDAKNHAQRTGHAVLVVVETRDLYRRRESS